MLLIIMKIILNIIVIYLQSYLQSHNIIQPKIKNCINIRTSLIDTIIQLGFYSIIRKKINLSLLLIIIKKRNNNT